MHYVLRQNWKRYLLSGCLVIFGVILLFLLEETIRLKNTGFDTKTLWDWMELLIVPLVLAAGALYLERSERVVERKIAGERIKEDRMLADARTKEDRMLAEDRAKLEREIATDRQQEAALQAYIARMSELLLEEKLRITKKAEVRDVARTQTISVMRVLDTRRNNLVLQFLHEANLITDENSILRGASMAKMNLQWLNLSNTYLQGTNLMNANLQGASLLATNFQSANMREANMQDANLRDAWVSEEVLAEAKYLRGATMPDGTIHE